MSPRSFQTIEKSSYLATLFSGRSFVQLIRSYVLLRHSRFVTVVYDDFHGIKRPIGLIHRLKVRGEMREVFTYCSAGKYQPGMALFVRRRTGNLADQVALSFEEQDRIPSYLKRLPDAYREQHFRRFSMAG